MPDSAADLHRLLLAGVTLPLARDGNGFVWTAADDARAVLLALRATRVDLLVLGLEIGDTPFDSLMRRVKAVRPEQKWALLSPDLDPAREVDARSLGVLAIFDGPPSAAQLREILNQLRPRPVVQPGVAADLTSLRLHRPRPPGRQRAPTSPTD